jgi:hypothetical protein
MLWLLRLVQPLLLAALLRSRFIQTELFGKLAKAFENVNIY